MLDHKGMDHRHRSADSQSVRFGVHRELLLVPQTHARERMFAFRYHLMDLHLIMGGVLHPIAKPTQSRGPESPQGEMEADEFRYRYQAVVQVGFQAPVPSASPRSVLAQHSRHRS